MKTFSYCIATIFCFFALNLFCGCNHYSTANPATDVSTYPKILERSKKDKRYFIMQSGVNLYTITSVDLDQAKKQITVTLDKVDSLRLVHFKNPAARQNQQNGLGHETHVYMKDSTSYTLDEPHTIPTEKIARIEMQN
jgi:hypothetical protein